MKPPALLPALALAATFFCSPIFSQPAAVRFSVCKVERATKPLEESDYRAAAEQAAALQARNQEKLAATFSSDSSWMVYELPAFSDSLLALPKFLESAAKLEALGEKPCRLVPAGSQNPLMHAMYLSYAQHRPLVLSPDMVWLLLAQGFAKHVELNAEQLRGRLVGFEGKKVLFVELSGYEKGDPNYGWTRVFPEFARQIACYTGRELAENMTPTFSTTGPVEAAAFEVALMDAMSPYFLYTVGIICGIPEITLEGTPEDWATLEKHAAGLAKYDLAWWTDELKPILHEFTEASKGKADVKFWQQMFRQNELPGCGAGSHLDGWIVKLFPYIEGKKNRWVTERKAMEGYFAKAEKVQKFKASKRAKRLREKDTDRAWRILEKCEAAHPAQFELPVVELDDLPGGLAKADVLLNYHGALSMLEFQAGFVGIRQDAATLALRPEISWLLIDTGEKPKEEDLDLYEKAKNFLENAGK